jgi:phage-related protein
MKCIVKKIVLRTINKLLKEYGSNIDKAQEVLKVWIEKLTIITALLESAMDKIEDKELTDKEVSDILSQLENAVDAIVKKK